MKNKLLQEAINCLVIQDVYLRECVIQQREDFNPKIPKHANAEVIFLHRALPAKVDTVTVENEEKPIKILRAYFEAIFRILPPRDSDEMMGIDLSNADATAQKADVDVKATFIAEYLITADELGTEAIAEFCQFNSGYHIWPYWRELTQSISNRLRLPPIIPPLYRVPPEAQPDEKKDL